MTLKLTREAIALAIAKEMLDTAKDVRLGRRQRKLASVSPAPWQPTGAKPPYQFPQAPLESHGNVDLNGWPVPRGLA